IAVASFSDRTIRRLGAELGGVVAETELAIGRVRVTVRQETSDLYAVAVRRTDIDAGAVRQAHEIGLLVGPGCAADEHEAQPRNHRQYTKRHGAASAVELGRGLGGHAVRTTAGHTRTLGQPPLGRSPHRPDAEQALCRRADVFALRWNLRAQGNRRAPGCGKLPGVALRPIAGRNASHSCFPAFVRVLHRSQGRPVTLDALHLDRARAESFGAATDAYDRFRSACAEALLGVELDERMAAAARRHGIAVEVAPFETREDGGRTYDLVTCSDAWHWIDPNEAWPRRRR